MLKLKHSIANNHKYIYIVNDDYITLSVIPKQMKHETLKQVYQQIKTLLTERDRPRITNKLTQEVQE
jgi:hypothetical protein